jgi:hypothetical protein
LECACFSTALRGTSPITVFGKRRSSAHPYPENIVLDIHADLSDLI